MSDTADATRPDLKLAKETSTKEPLSPPEQPPAADEPPAVSDSSEQDLSTESIVEAVLFASDNPLPAAKIAEIVGESTGKDAKKHIAALNEKYHEYGTAFRIEEIAGGFQMLTLSQYNPYLGKLLRVREETRLSQAALETLAIVAYKQPVLRADVETIRGVQCGEMLNRLRETNLVKIVGRAEDVGRPILYGTTKKFLEVFGLGSLDDLPQIEELTPPEAQ